MGSKEERSYDPSFLSNSMLVKHISEIKVPNHFNFMLPCGSDGKESACNAEDPGSLSELGRSPGEGHGNPLQYSSLENPMDRGAWQATVHGVAKSQTWLSERSCSPSLLSNSMLVKHVSEIKMPTHFILLSLTEIRFKDTSMSYPLVFALSLGCTLIMLSRSSLLKKKKIRSVLKYSHSIF